MNGILYGLCAVVGLVVAVGAAAWAFQDRLIYMPDRHRPALADLGALGVAEVAVVTADGLRLVAWQRPAASDTAPLLLYLHGNGGNIAYRAPRLAEFARLGWGVLMLEWRGYGGNAGSPSEAGLRADAEAGLAALLAVRRPGQALVIYGESLGTAPAVALAAAHPEAVTGLVLESPFTSMLALARLHYAWLPAGLLLRDRFDSLAAIGRVRAPLLILQGAQDRLVPPEMGRALAAAAGGPVEVWVAPEGGHNDLRAWGALEAAAGFVRGLAGRAGF